ncbi:methyl-accepting chemotaxis protein [bacterium]|nr:methyl-accepting chemotaxis protein [bacterium]
MRLKLNLSMKLIFIPAVVLVAFIIIFLIMRNAIKKNEEMMNKIVRGYVPAWEISQNLLESLENIQYSLQNAVAAEDLEELTQADNYYQTFLELVQKQADNHVIDQTAEMSELKNMVEEYYTLSRGNSQRLIKGETGEQMIWELENMTKQYNNIKNLLNQKNQINKKNMKENFENAIENNAKAEGGITILALIAFIFIVAFSWYMVNSITGPLKSAIQVVSRISEGDLTIKVKESNSNDEVGILMRSFKNMLDTLRNMTSQIKEAANGLATAASEISASVTQIASSATETATAANETSTTVEEVRQTALDSNRKAKHVSESAQKAVQISQAGEKSVSETVEGMHRIEQQMESIAQSIMKLSEHGQAIGGIIATVEDVAEQSNLLAVNASIEAAKAGEQGKGFAVVAQEVKSLAEQSRQATLRVRQILDDIQKSTSSAVMTTEQGSKAVEAGVAKSKEAGDSIQRLANSVGEAAQATTQISVSSQEQLVGMDQVVSAMESIKQASTQNVTATKQVESASRDLHDLGQRLKQLVEQYII